MLQRLGIRGKILAVVAVPILVLVVAAAFVTLNAVNQLSRANNIAQLVEVIDSAKEFNAALRDEGDAASNYIDAWVVHQDQRERPLTSVDDSIATVNDIAPSGTVSRVDSALSGGEELLGLADVRNVWPERDGEVTTWPTADQVQLVADSYAAMIAAIQDVPATGNEAVDAAVDDIAFFMNQEATRTSNFLTETPVLQAEFEETVPVVDSAWSALERDIAAVADIPANESVQELLATAADDVASLDSVRGGTRLTNAGAQPTFAYYFSITQTLVDVADEVRLIVDDPTLVRRVDAYGATDQLMEEMAAEDNQVDRLLRAEQFAQGAATAIRNQFAATDFAREDAKDALEALEVGYDLPATGASFDAASQSDYQGVRNRVADGSVPQLLNAIPLDWTTQVAEEVEVIVPYYDESIDLVADTASDNAQSALLQAILTAVGAVLVVLASLFIALLIARRIVNPLRRLTTTATAVRQELPRLVERVALPGETVDVSEVQIPVESRDEVGRLAEAFNSVNAATLAIAGEQAALRGSISEMFVNVARRDQVLLNRQLASIDEMERTEDDPDTLTKLFALDHLATRMRRNSESLLVLAGIDTGRRLRRPMPLSDVIRTASSEIELYERVQLELDADPAMVGHSALTAAHLFAELLENATVFSDPGTPVTVRTGERGGNYVVEVTDTGIGMTLDELREANGRVASTAASEILGAQRLGLFVVGRIARRIGARVEITSTEGEGTTAVVTMPPSLFDASVEVDTSHRTESTSDEAMHVPSALVSHDTSNEFMEAAPTAAPAAPATERPAASVGEYKPTAIEEGASLTGRGSDGPVEDLIAADAEAAPSGQAADPAALTEGVSSAGLPTRRRKASQGPAAPAETDSIIGLPARATTEQLSALEADADSGFTPTVSANEVAPQTAEQRASMFRGFRSRRDAADADVDVAPDAESLGQAARRGGIDPGTLAAAAAAGSAGAGAAQSVPSLEPDQEPSTPAPAEEEPSAASAFAVEPADVRVDEEPTTGQSPLISRGYEHHESEAEPPSFEVPTLAGAGGAMDIPSLEDDDEPEPAAAAPEPSAAAGVEAVSLADDGPQAPATEPPAPEQQIAPEQSSTEYSAPAPPPDSPPAPTVPQVDRASVLPGAAFAGSAAAASTAPSLDDLIAGEPDDEPGEAKGGFFSRLFGKGGKEEPEQPSAPSAPSAFAPTGGDPTLPSGEQPQAPFTGEQPQAPFTPEPAPASAFTPQEPAGSFQPQSEPSADAGWHEQTPAPGAQAEPAADQWAGSAPEVPQAYSPDQLATPLGWEAAGASALQAADPDIQTTYRPVMEDIQPAPMDDEDSPDVTSQVFSELSSLSTERPKVQKTKAGLTKRRSEGDKPVEVTPIEPEVHVEPANRDADAVRHRFSSFYSGTQRARHDAEEFQHRSQTASAND